MNIQQLPLNPCGGGGGDGGGKKRNYGTQLLGCWTPYLPIEVIEQIILLLPPKSVGRCRSVSKQWRALLSSPQFIRAHTFIITTPPPHSQSVSIISKNSWMRFTLTNHNHVTASLVPHRNLHLPMSLSLVSSCHGLVYVCQNASQSLLVNPTTGHTREIPNLIYPITQSTITFDGIGFDSITNDYKIVSLFLIYNPQVDDSTHELFVHIYSVNDGAWKTCISLPNFFGYRLRSLRSLGVFVGRCIHWLIQREADFVLAIIAFDVVEEKFHQVPIPTHHSFQHLPNHYSYGLDVLAGHLCVTTVIANYLNVWVMNKYGIQESWTRIARIRATKNTWFKPLCLVGQENLVLIYVNNFKFEKLVTYNVTEKTFKDVDIRDGSIKDLPYATIPFDQTMVSLYGMSGDARLPLLDDYMGSHTEFVNINNTK